MTVGAIIGLDPNTPVFKAGNVRDTPVDLFKFSSSAHSAFGEIIIHAASTGSVARVSEAPDGSYVVSLDGTDHVFARSEGSAGVVKFFGNGGDDRFQNDAPSLRVYAESGVGNDSLVGGPGNDTLLAGDGDDTVLGNGGNDYMQGDDILPGSTGNDWMDGGIGDDDIAGWNGNDTLIGREGRDSLYGNAGNDDLYGGANEDYLDGGTGSDLMSGGTEFDFFYHAFNPNTPAPNGTQVTDVDQNRAGTCSIDSALASLANGGFNVATRVRYLGNNHYGVTLFEDDWLGFTEAKEHTVTFDGSWNDNDPMATSGRVSDSMSFWPTVMQRAYLQRWGVDLNQTDWTRWTNRDRWARAENATFAVTGWRTYESDAGDLDTPEHIQGFVNHGDVVIAATAGKAVANPNKFVNSHAYAVTSVDRFNGTWWVTLYNPWATDGPKGAVDGPNDGFLTITWAEYTANFNYYARSVRPNAGLASEPEEALPAGDHHAFVDPAPDLDGDPPPAPLPEPAPAPANEPARQAVQAPPAVAPVPFIKGKVRRRGRGHKRR